MRVKLGIPDQVRQQVRQQEAAFIDNGYSRSNIIKDKSILDAVLQIRQGSVIMVSSVKFCKTHAELLALLCLLQDKNITLRSILEPWLNIPIAEHMQSVAKIHKLIAFNDDEI